MISLPTPAVQFSPQQATVTLTQESSNWCGGNFANIQGNVTVICKGVPPAVVASLNAQLRRANLSRAEAVQQANRWIRAYKQLEQMLADLAPGSPQVKEAQAALQKGNLDRVTGILRGLLHELVANNGGANLPDSVKQRIAAEEYSLGLATRLQSQLADALPHFEHAYQLRPREWRYAQEYASALLDGYQWVAAEPVLLTELQDANADSETQPLERAATHMMLATLYSSTGRLGPAQFESEEALALERETAPNRPGEAQTLNNLAVLYRHAERIPQAEKAFLQALTIFRELATSQPDLYQPYVAEALSNVGSLYSDTGRLQEAERYYTDALQLCAKMAEANPAAYQEVLAKTQANLANVYRMKGQFRQAEEFFLQAEGSFKDLIAADPETFEPLLTTMRGNEIVFYAEAQQNDKAYAIGQQALSSAQQLAVKNPAVYNPLLATILERTGSLETQMLRLQEAERALGQALRIRRPLAEASPAAEVDLARTLTLQGNLYRTQERYPEAETDYKESLEIFERMSHGSATVFASERAIGRYNLAELYQRIPKLAEAEPLYQTALDTFRTLAQTDPAGYLGYVSRTLCGQALLHRKLQQDARYRQEIKEAIDIDTKRIATGDASGPDALSRSLLLVAMIAESMPERCFAAEQASKIAVDSGIKQQVEQILGTCPR